MVSTPIRLLLADDQALVRGALAALLALEPDLDVVAEVGRGDEVLPEARRTRPDVALLDVEMPGLDGISATRDLRAALPSCRVLVVTTFGRPGYLRRAMAAGASGFVVKDTPARQLADAVRRVASGLRVVDPSLAAETLAAGDSPLTPRETDVLRAARDGGTVADIAAALHLSEGTVRNHLSAAIGKTGARTRAEAVRLASTNGWLLGSLPGRSAGRGLHVGGRGDGPETEAAQDGAPARSVPGRKHQPRGGDDLAAGLGGQHGDVPGGGGDPPDQAGTPRSRSAEMNPRY